MLIEDAERNALEVSALSLTEIAIKHSCGKLNVGEEIARTALEDLDARVLPYIGAHAYRFFRLPRHHRDPFDRMLIGQALAENIPIVTPDETFQHYEGLKVIWN